MAEGKVNWGNLMMDENAKKPAKKTPSPKGIDVNTEILENWVMPNLTKRKGVWENFPVVMKELPEEGDGILRFAVEWHNKNVEEWKGSRSASYDEWMEYKAWAEFRLLHALRHHSHIYKIEPPRAPNQIIVLNAGERPANAPASAAAPMRRAPSPRRSPPAAAATGVPILRKLMDIKENFPNVIWNKVTDGAPGETTYAIVIKGDYARRAPAAQLATFKAQLEAALSASRFWYTLPPAAAGEFKRIQMKHD